MCLPLPYVIFRGAVYIYNILRKVFSCYQQPKNPAIEVHQKLCVECMQINQFELLFLIKQGDALEKLLPSMSVNNDGFSTMMKLDE